MNSSFRMAQAPAAICVVGAGAIGCYFAARLACAGHRVSMIARGAALSAIRERGVSLSEKGGSIEAAVRATDDPDELGAQDIVLIAVKTPALASAAALVRRLSNEGTTIVPAQNGVPWWYFLPEHVRFSGMRLESVDPEGTLERAFPLDQVVGIVTFLAATCPEPGKVNVAGDRVVLGAPSGFPGNRVESVAGILAEAGLAATVSEDLRRDIWLKLLANACYNPVSLLTGADNAAMFGDPHVRALLENAMSDLIEIGKAIGVGVSVNPSERIEQSYRTSGNSRTSMLQDLEAGRQVEISALVGAPLEIADSAGVPAPHLRNIHALARLRAMTLGLYPDKAS